MIAAALDIGGANIKAARSDGPATTLPFALWKAPQRLEGVLEEALVSLGTFDRLAVTMTGELCDCFETRSEGVRHIVQSALAAAAGCAPGVPVDVWLLDGTLVPAGRALEEPRRAAAGNWLALAAWAARHAARERDHAQGILADIGSTTTDLISLRGGKPVPRGLTDTERLSSGELVYTGVGRTPVFALLPEVNYRGKQCRVASEIFSTTLDTYLVLGDLPEDPLDRHTADGREATRKRAIERLARVVCADNEDFTGEDARDLARQFARAQLNLLETALDEVIEATSSQPRVAILSGQGEFLARRLVESRGIRRVLSLSELAGPGSSRAACAFALSRIAAERLA